jgi:hypothetical protein
MTRSWKTTTGGIIAIVIALLTLAKDALDGTDLTMHLPEALAGISLGAGLLFARDAKVSSEQEGIR